jgi:hypothetical protein
MENKKALQWLQGFFCEMEFISGFHKSRFLAEWVGMLQHIVRL